MSRFHAYLQQRQAPETANPMGEAAVALGMPVFPCAADKRPLTGHGFKDASADPVRIRAMFADPRAVLIGVPTGRASGWAVIDVDTKDGGRGQEWLDANTHRLPSTRTHVTRSGGWHLIFRMPDADLRNSAGRVAPNVDVRADGGYICMGTGYHLVPDGPEPAEMPDWLLQAALKPELAAVPHSMPRRESIPDRYAEAALNGECRAVSGAREGTRNHTLNVAAVKLGGLIGAGALSRATVEAELTAVARAAGLGAIETARTIKSGIDFGQRQPREIADPVPAEEVHPAAAFLAKIAARAAQKDAKPLPVAPGLMDVQGALRLFVEHCEATAISAQPFLALAAGICLVGALAGRKYRTKTDLRTNIYAVGVADSGAGKDHARKIIKQALAAANLTRYLGGEDLASGASVYTALARHPAMLFQIDEFGDWLADVLGPKAATHKKQIAQRLKSLYSSANTFLSGTEYADQSKAGRPREDIQQPHACLYGTTTPGQLWAAIAGGSLHDGLMARMLLFVSPCSYPDECEPEVAPVPPALVQALQAIAAGADHETGNLAALMASNTAPEPFCVPQTAAADQAWRDLRSAQLAAQRRAEGTYVTAIAGRLAENAMKLALVRAVSRDPVSPVIEASDVAWGRAVAEHCVQTLLREADQNVAESEFEQKLNKALAIIRKHGPATPRDLFRRGLKLPERERDEVLRSLVGAGLVIETRSGGETAGRPTVRYSAAAAPAAPFSDE